MRCLGFRQLSLCAILSAGMSAAGETHGFGEYVDELKELDVAVTAPEGMRYNDDPAYRSENGYQTYTLDVNPDLRIPGCGHKYPNIGWVYSAAFESEDKDAVMLFPTSFGHMAQLDSSVELEIQASHSDQDMDVRKYLTVIAREDMSEYADADTAIVYEFDILGKPFMDRYTHVIGVYLRKYAHPSLLMKIVTDDKGLARKEELLERLISCVKYGDAVTEEGLKWEKDYPGDITILKNSPSRPSPHQH